MSDHRYYLSVMTPVASAGDVTIDMQTRDADFNISIAATISGITPSLTEYQIAQQIEWQLTTILQASGAYYDGVPRFSAEPFAASWRVTRSDHVVCLWSQAEFDTQTTNDTTGGIYYLSTSPLLCTVAEAKARAVVNAVSLVDKLNHVAFSDLQICDFIESGSADLCAYLMNNVTLSSYLAEFRANDTKSVFIRPLPIRFVDVIRIRRKNLYEMYSIPQYSGLAYNKLYSTGEIEFRFNQNYVNAGEPYSLDNEVRITYIAGMDRIPSEIKKATLLMAEYNNNEHKNLQSLGGGSLKIAYGDHLKHLDRIFRPVRKYRMSKTRG